MLRICLCAALALLPLSTATASIYLRSLSRTQTGGFGLSDGRYQEEDTGRLAVSPGASLHTDVSVSSNNSPYGGAGAEGSAWITTQFGEFHADLHASAFSGAGHSYVGSNAYAFGQWEDQVTVSSSTLAPGTPLSITATIEVDRMVSDGAPASSWYTSLYTNGVQYYDGYDRPNPSSTATLTYYTSVGGTFGIWQTLNAYVATQTVVNGQSDSIDLDLGNTVHFYLTAPEDVTLTSASGATYSRVAAVPEPATLAVWTLGAFGCALVALAKKMGVLS